MVRWLHVIGRILAEALAVRRDPQVQFLQAQVRILRRKLGGNRVILNPRDRAELLRLGSAMGHQVHSALGIVTSQTYRRWVREASTARAVGRVGRPGISRDCRTLILRLARENLAWGYRRINGELRKLRVFICHMTVQRILRQEGIYPPPNRGLRLVLETPWRKFLRLHMNTLVACDFFTKNVLTLAGTRIAYGLFFIHLATRRVFLCPMTYQPDQRWVLQQARHLLMWLEDQGLEAKYLIHDRDTKFTVGFDSLLQTAGLLAIKTPRRAPNANAFAESWIGSLKRECLNFFTCFSLGHVRHIVEKYVQFYNEHRPHQGLRNRTVALAATGPPGDRLATTPSDLGRIRCQRFLGGLLRHYYRAAA